MKNDNPFYSLRDSTTYILFKLFKARDLDPGQTIQEILLSAKHTGGYTPKLRFPNAEKKQEMAKKFRRSSNPSKKDIEKTYLSGFNACIKHLKEINTEEEYLKAESEHKLYRPIDLSLRHLAFSAKISGFPFKTLISALSRGVLPDNADVMKIKDWKRDYDLEKLRHEETKNRLGQIFDEKEAAKRIIAELRRELHKEGLQDPTLQVREEGGSNPTSATDKDDVQHENSK